MMNAFRNFIKKQLLFAGVKETRAEQLITPEAINNFRAAFTHETYTIGAHESVQNYEYYEFMGDTFVNESVAKFIAQRYPHIRNVDWLTHIKHGLQSRRTLGNLAEAQGFRDHIRYGEMMAREIEMYKPDYSRSAMYTAMLEDTFEAFVGCLLSTFFEAGLTAAGYVVAQSYIFKCLDRVEISLEWLDVFPPKTKLGEMYKKLGWCKGVSEMIRVTRDDTAPIKTFTATVYGMIRGTRQVVATATAYQSSDAQSEACKKAIRTLVVGHGFDPPVIPAQTENKTKIKKWLRHTAIQQNKASI